MRYHGYKCNYRGGFNLGTILFTGEASTCRINDALLGLGQLALLGQVILVGSNMIYLLEQVDEPGAGQGNGICQMIQGQTFC